MRKDYYSRVGGNNRRQSDELQEVSDDELRRIRSLAQALRRSPSSIFRTHGANPCCPAGAASGHHPNVMLCRIVASVCSANAGTPGRLSKALRVREIGDSSRNTLHRSGTSPERFVELNARVGFDRYINVLINDQVHIQHQSVKKKVMTYPHISSFIRYPGLPHGLS